MSYRRAAIIVLTLLALLLAARAGVMLNASSTPTSTPTPTAVPVMPTYTPLPPLQTPTPAPMPMPTPFRDELILCAGPEPATLLDGTPSADLVRRALSAHPVTYREDYTAAPGILAALPNAADGTLVRNADGTFTVTLRYREGLVWSDGTPFSADDAALGMVVPFDDRLPDPTILETTVVDDLTLQLVLGADAGYPYVPDAPPLPSHLLWGDLERLRANAYARTFNPGLGPYVLQEWGEGEMILTANPASVPQPMMQTIRVRFFNQPEDALSALLAGGCDVLAEGDWRLSEGSAIRAYTINGPLWAHLDFNLYPDTPDRPAYFADVRVRQAVTYALTPSELINWLPSNHWAAGASAAPKPYTRDPVRAVALLEEAGWVDANHDSVREYAGARGEDACGRAWSIEEGAPFRVQLLYPQGDPRRDEASHRIAIGLSTVGIAVETVAVPADEFYSSGGPLERRAFDLALYSWPTLPEPDGLSRWLGEDIYLHPLDLVPAHLWELPAPLDESDPPPELTAQIIAANSIPSSANDYQGQNFPGWCDPEADMALANATWSLDVTERQTYYAVHLARFAEELPTLPLFWYTQTVLAQPYVCGIQPSAVNGLTWNIADWTLDQSGACNGMP
jgi:peptide/nickel transport system substrate-binding protein